VGEVQAGAAGVKELPDASTAVRSESWPKVGQSETMAAAGRATVDSLLTAAAVGELDAADVTAMVAAASATTAQAPAVRSGRAR
jgi:hypothetical protein